MLSFLLSFGENPSSRRVTRGDVGWCASFCPRRVALCKIFVRNEIFLGAISRRRDARADSFRLSVSKNGVTQMFIIAAARRGKNVG